MKLPQLANVIDDVRPNPDVAELEATWTRFWRDPQAGEVLVAVGGGSVIDTAKALMVGNDSLDFDDMVRAMGDTAFTARQIGDAADVLEAMARDKGVTAAQLALAWVHAQGDDIFPIPGTKRVSFLEQNAKALDLSLSAQEQQMLSEMFPPGVASGARYPEPAMKGLGI